MSKRHAARPAEDLEAVVDDFETAGPTDWVALYLSHLRGYVIKHYHWVEGRGDCLMTVDDLVQVASIELMKQAADWDEIKPPIIAYPDKSLDETERIVFWKYLRRRVYQEIIQYQKTTTHHGWTKKHDSIDGEGWEAETWDDARTRVRGPHETVGSMIAMNAIVDYFSLLPQRARVQVALRYFDELPLDQVGSLMESPAGSVSTANRNTADRLRTVARNQFLDDIEYLPATSNHRWEPPQILVDYLRNRHDMDVNEYCGIVTIAFRQDVSYLSDILGRDLFYPPGARPVTALSPFQQTQADVMLAAGMTHKEIGNRLGVAPHNISTHSARRHFAETT